MAACRFLNDLSEAVVIETVREFIVQVGIGCVGFQRLGLSIPTWQVEVASNHNGAV